MADKIMIIRHAERPEEGENAAPFPCGVNEKGEYDKESLTPLGWQRAGALVRLFVPRSPAAALPDPRLASPKLLIASHVAPGSPSRRPRQTISAIAKALNGHAEVNHSLPKGAEDKVAEAALAAAGPVLVCWEHGRIDNIVRKFAHGAPGVPDKFPERFDLVWVFDRNGGGWTFTPVPQLLLPGDTAAI
jgi:hypothetical protein